MITISQEAKDAIIEALKEEQYEYEEGGDCYETIEDVIEIVESFPVSDGWIPVTESLPSDMEEVNTYDRGIYRYGSRVSSEELMFQCSSSGIWYVPTYWKYVDNPPTPPVTK